VISSSDWLEEYVTPRLGELGCVISADQPDHELVAQRVSVSGEQEFRFRVDAGYLFVHLRVMRQDPISPPTDWRPIRLDLMGLEPDRLGWSTRAEAEATAGRVLEVLQRSVLPMLDRAPDSPG